MGEWRTHPDPMRVMSRAVGKTKARFEAPPSEELPERMDGFVKWFNDSSSELRQAPVRSALVHLYFESLHPFEDGNGRIGRALSEKAISQGLGRPALLSLSQALEADKSAYYDALEQAQKCNEVTSWIRYFVGIAAQAQARAEEQIDFVLRKTRFFDTHREVLSERQLKVVRRMLDEGPDGFEGGMNARKYGSLTGVSKATATRDLQTLVEQGVFVPTGGGRSTRYKLSL
ncbi:Fic family protein [Pelagicoccus sp. SDUM812003]|nr:Fic family protein [Pelagicoccus sp. SDUM812003]